MKKMKYAIIKVINGAYSIHAEGFTTVEAAKVNYHGLCQTLWNAKDVLNAYVAIVDEQLDVVEGYKEFIHHDPAPVEPEPVEGEEE
jgi:hypothetical protein